MLSGTKKLVRVIEEKKLVRVGGVDTVDIDVRLMAASNRILKDEVRSGRFREDLYFRLNVFPIELPTLAEQDRNVIELDDEPLAVTPGTGDPGGLEAAEKRMILAALDKTDGNKTEATRPLKITRRRTVG